MPFYREITSYVAVCDDSESSSFVYHSIGDYPIHCCFKVSGDHPILCNRNGGLHRVIIRLFGKYINFSNRVITRYFVEEMVVLNREFTRYSLNR